MLSTCTECGSGKEMYGSDDGTPAEPQSGAMPHLLIGGNRHIRAYRVPGYSKQEASGEGLGSDLQQCTWSLFTRT